MGNVVKVAYKWLCTQKKKKHLNSTKILWKSIMKIYCLTSFQRSIIIIGQVPKLSVIIRFLNRQWN